MRLLAGFLVLACGTTPAFAGFANSLVFNVSPVPALGDIALIGLTLVVGIAGGIVARRRGRDKRK